MEGFGDFLGGVGLFLCIGALIVVALLAMAVRAFSRPRADGPFEQRGPESSRYDEPDIEGSAGFGGVPTTGSVQDYERDYDRDLDRDQPGTVGSSGFGGARTFGEGDRDRTDEDDDDQATSSGGFGKG